MFKITFNPPTFNNLTLCYMFFYFFSFEDKEGRLPRYAIDVAPIFSREMYNQQNILALGKKTKPTQQGFLHEGGSVVNEDIGYHKGDSCI